MKILFATNFYYLPQRTGGNESSTNDLCVALMEKDHDVAVICAIKKHNLIWLKNRILSKFLKRKFIEDKLLGYPVYRGYNVKEHIVDVVDKFMPDVVVVQAGNPFEIVNALSLRKIPVVLYVRDVEFDKNTEQLILNKFVGFVSNSKFTAGKLKNKLNVDSVVIPPLVDDSKYRVPKEGNSVVHVGLSPLKGIDISFALARSRPDIPFIFVESWPLPDKEYLKYQERAKKTNNVKLMRRCRNMRKIYKKARVVLAPSVCEEAWGRVVTEAQFSGIPVIASNRGGLPEAVGDGGIIVPYDADIDTWHRALSKVWDSTVIHSDLSIKALERSRMDDVSKDININILIDYLKKHVMTINSGLN